MEWYLFDSGKADNYMWKPINFSGINGIVKYKIVSKADPVKLCKKNSVIYGMGKAVTQ